ncbi:MAG: transaldolase, partial [Acidobacteria bacterium]|nr:transaldolase [Acidobacteriota bacterium]
GIVDDRIAGVSELAAFGREVKAGGFQDVIVLGMGGSSLCPEVLGQTFGRQAGFPRLRIVDSTDPGQIRDIEQSIDRETTLFIVSSKSGSTLEPDILKKYFFEWQQARRKPAGNGSSVSAARSPLPMPGRPTGGSSGSFPASAGNGWRPR